MKALEILKKIKSINWWHIRNDISSNINEAIAELEEAMKQKSCDGCKHFNEYYKFADFVKDTNRCEKHSMYVEYDFYCNRYEPKETK